MMWSASWRCPPCISSKLSRSLARSTPSTGMSRRRLARSCRSSALARFTEVSPAAADAVVIAPCAETSGVMWVRETSMKHTTTSAESTSTINAARPDVTVLALDVDRDAGRGERRELERVPIGEVDAAMGLDAPHERGLRRAVDAVVRLAEPHPQHADRAVGPGGDLHTRVLGIVVGQLARVVVERGIAHLAHHLQPAGRKLVVALQCLPGLLVDLARRAEAVGFLECGYGAAHVLAEAAVDLAG